MRRPGSGADPAPTAVAATPPAAAPAAAAASKPASKPAASKQQSPKRPQSQPAQASKPYFSKKTPPPRHFQNKKPVVDYNAQAAQADAPKKPMRPRRSNVPKPRIAIPKFITLSNFANVLGIGFHRLQRQMTEMGFTELTHDHIIEEETAVLVADELGFEAVVDEVQGVDLFPASNTPEEIAKMPLRPPIVTIMGHVDHGKTTILDYLRNSSIAAGEHGGITQHIGAFNVKLSNNKQICFLDTPGHAAFLNMRERGANVTDIVVLVVAADDSVMPQTKEAIKHAKAAGVPMIVAINKMDKAGANPDKVIADLSANEVDVEDYGGETQTVPVSGKTGMGIDKLEEAIITLSEIQELRAPVTGPSEGWVIESQVKKGLGPSATVLVRRGTLKTGSFIVAGNTWCKVKSLRDDHGKVIKKTGPGTPVEVTGWKMLPEAGDEMLEAKSESFAKQVVDNRTTRAQQIKEASDIAAINEKRRKMHEEQDKAHARLERLRLGLPAEAVIHETVTESADGLSTSTSGSAAEGPKIMSYIIKADVSGSAEAVAASIEGLGNSEVRATVLYKGVGPVNDTDLARAETANAQILTFNLNVERDIRSKAERKQIGIVSHSIIYRLLEDVTAQLASQLKPEIKQKVLGEAIVREIFDFTLKSKKSAKKISIAGSRVTNGRLAKKSLVRVLRDKKVVFSGNFSSLKHFKDEVEEIKKDTDCGITFDGWSDFQPGDIIQTYEEIEVPRYL
jgi:translation initiation factor IF-2